MGIGKVLLLRSNMADLLRGFGLDRLVEAEELFINIIIFEVPGGHLPSGVEFLELINDKLGENVAEHVAKVLIRQHLPMFHLELLPLNNVVLQVLRLVAFREIYEEPTLVDSHLNRTTSVFDEESSPEFTSAELFTSG